MEELLTEKEKALAWDASWNPSLSGIAIVSKDFKFLSVNQQFCEVVGVTPGELIGQTFQDVTDPKIRELDERNAKLVMEGKARSYLLPKKYRFPSGHISEILLLVVGVYDKEDCFQFFVSRIMKDAGETVIPPDLDTYHYPKESTDTSFLSKNRDSLVGILVAGIAGACIYLLDYFYKQ